MADYTTVSWPL